MALVFNKIGRILIVDDDPISILISETLLQKHFHVSSVSNGFDAIKAVEENEFDIVLMDINLGNELMDGVATMKLIRQITKCANMKIFAITSYSPDDLTFLNQGFDRVYIKPIIKEEIIDAMKDQMCA